MSLERAIQLTFRPGQWLAADEKADVMVMWFDGEIEVLPARTAIERDGGRGTFRWTRLPPRAAIWG